MAFDHLNGLAEETDDASMILRNHTAALCVIQNIFIHRREMQPYSKRQSNHFGSLLAASTSPAGSHVAGAEQGFRHRGALACTGFRVMR